MFSVALTTTDSYSYLLKVAMECGLLGGNLQQAVADTALGACSIAL